MAKKSSDPHNSADTTVRIRDRRKATVFVVASDETFLGRVANECSQLPEDHTRFASIDDLMEALSRFDRISLAFLLLVENHGHDVDAVGLRQLRLDYPQLVILAILGGCDQQSLLRLQSIGVHNPLLPPFSDIDISKEIATALPNVPQFKRHPDLMRRGQARFDFLIPSDLKYVLGINHQISLLLKEFGFPLQDTRINIPLACDEAITNAIVHGNRSQADKKVNVQIYVSHTRFRMRVRDQGEGFDVAKVADPREGENVHLPSGRGVFLMKRIMDSVNYKQGGRVLELEKFNSEANANGSRDA